MTTTLVASQIPCALCSKSLEYAEQFECSTCDRTVCRDCSNQHTIAPVVRCKVCLKASEKQIAREACGEMFKPSEGYYEAEQEPTYSYCADCCHW